MSTPFPVVFVVLTLLPLSALYSHINANTAASANVNAVVKANNKTLPLLSTPTTKRYCCCQRQQQNVTAVVNANDKILINKNPIPSIISALAIEK
jgi:hypothetical protein